MRPEKIVVGGKGHFYMALGIREKVWNSSHVGTNKLRYRGEKSEGGKGT